MTISTLLVVEKYTAAEGGRKFSGFEVNLALGFGLYVFFNTPGGWGGGLEILAVESFIQVFLAVGALWVIINSPVVTVHLITDIGRLVLAQTESEKKHEQ